MEELNNVTNEQTGSENKLTFTQSELDALLQREGDKRVSQALATAERKNDAKIKEATKLALMDEQQRHEYELEKREAALVEKEKQLALAENKNAASRVLADKGISLNLVDFVVDESAEVMDARIKLLDAEFKKSVKAEVSKRLGSTIPKKNAADPEGISREQFKSMSLSERQELANTNPELYKTLRNS